MRVVVDIPNWLYNAIMTHREPQYSQSLGDAVRDGTPLPKGHGRIIDESQISSVEYHEEIENIGTLFEIVHMIIDSTDAPTIIEADTGETECQKLKHVSNMY